MHKDVHCKAETIFVIPGGYLCLASPGFSVRTDTTFSNFRTQLLGGSSHNINRIPAQIRLILGISHIRSCSTLVIFEQTAR
jgi:hypothetical protein